MSWNRRKHPSARRTEKGSQCVPCSSTSKCWAAIIGSLFAVKYYFRLTTIIFPFRKREYIAVVGLCGMWESRSDFQGLWKAVCAFHQSVISTGFGYSDWVSCFAFLACSTR